MDYYLLRNTNRHAPGGFWGRATRGAKVRLLVIHTTENAFDTVGPDTGAENVAAYLARIDRAASYHDICDSDSHVPCLPWDYTAFGTRGGFNDAAIHMAFAGKAAGWDELSADQVEARLAVLAEVARKACAEYRIPIARLTGADARADGARGVCGHVDLDPSRRTDPGAGFPWSRFLAMLSGDDTTPPAPDPQPQPEPTPTPAATWQEEIIDAMDTVNLSDVAPDDKRTWVRGEDVRTLQCLLVARRHAPADTIDDDGDVDGIGGPGTRAALEAFQRAHPSTYSTSRPDAIAGPKTWGALTGV